MLNVATSIKSDNSGGGGGGSGDGVCGSGGKRRTFPGFMFQCIYIVGGQREN